MSLPVATPRETRAWVRAELRSRVREVAGTVGVGLLAAAAGIVPVWVLGVLVDRVLAGAGTAVIVPIIAIIAGSAVVAALGTGLSTAMVSGLGGRLLADLREAAVTVALRLPATVLDRAGRGDLLSRVGADVAAITKAVTDALPTMISSLLLGALSLAALAGIDWRLGLAGALAVPMYVVALRWYLPRCDGWHARDRARAS